MIMYDTFVDYEKLEQEDRERAELYDELEDLNVRVEVDLDGDKWRELLHKRSK